MSQPTARAMWIGECLLKALLMEVSAWPKPGLVTPHSQGAHKDMDIWLFITSSSAIAPCFSACAHAGENHQGSPWELFTKIRAIGIHYENTLLRATQQVNTQRGILFSGTVLATAAGWLSGRGETLSYNALSQCVAELCRDLCRRDFAALAERPAQTHGEKLYVGFGITGVRGEAEQGFPLVCQIGLPALHQALDNGMAHCDDTTVLFRGGQQALAEMKQYARRLVTQGGMFNPAIEQQLADFNSWCMDKWVSPGGSGDLLALCLAMYFLCRQPQGDMT